MSPTPKRLTSFIILIIIIILGLYSRSISGNFTKIIDLKDLLWAMMVYFLFRIVFIEWPIKRVAVSTLLFSIVIEVSQLYHSQWIDKLRETFLGGIILGTSFVWSDFIAYSVGIGLCILLESYFHFLKN